MGSNALIILPRTVEMMFIVGLLAVIDRTRQGLVVEPTEVLRVE